MSLSNLAILLVLTCSFHWCRQIFLNLFMSKVEKNRGRVYFSVGASAWPKKTGISTGAKNRETTLFCFSTRIFLRENWNYRNLKLKFKLKFEIWNLRLKFAKKFKNKPQVEILKRIYFCVFKSCKYNTIICFQLIPFSKGEN